MMMASTTAAPLNPLRQRHRPHPLLRSPPNLSLVPSTLHLVRPKTSISSYRNSSTPPETECPVPLDQQPVNEYQNLSTSLPFSWAAGDIRLYSSRLALTGASFALFVGLPVAAFGKGTVVDPQIEGLKVIVGAISTGLLAVTLAVLRMYLGWAYVGNRLLSATVEYEETGWYDGQIWVKTPEVLARDRLLGSYSAFIFFFTSHVVFLHPPVHSFEVKPVLTRVKHTLVGLAVSLAACVILFINIENPKAVASDSAGGRAISGVYNEASARSFEPDAFCGDASPS